MADDILVNLVVDDSQLQTLNQKLTATGNLAESELATFDKVNTSLKTQATAASAVADAQSKITTSVTKEQAVYDKLAASVKNLSGQTKDAVTNLLKMSASDVAQKVNETVGSVDEYIRVLKLASDAENELVQKSPKQELKEISTELATLAANGIKSGARFEELTARAGLLKNAIGDTQQLIGTLGQDVPAVKLLGQTFQGVTAAFTGVTGAAALFGAEGKDLQEVLVKVNAVMAINAGLSEVINLLNDEAYTGGLKLVFAKKAENVETAIANGLESESIIVRTAATVAQKALNLAVSANPYVLFALAVVGIVTALISFASASAAAAKRQAEFNNLIATSGKLLTAYTDGVTHAVNDQVAELDRINAKQSQILSVRKDETLLNLKEQQKELAKVNAAIAADDEENYQQTSKSIIGQVFTRNKTLSADNRKTLEEQRDQLIKTTYDGENKRKELILQTEKAIQVESLQAAIDTTQARLDLAVKNSNKQFDLQRQLTARQLALDVVDAGTNAEKVNAARAKANAAFRDIQAAQDQVAADQYNAMLETSLIEAQDASRKINGRISAEETADQIAIIQATADQEVTIAGKTATDIYYIRKKAAQDIATLNEAQREREIVDAETDANAVRTVTLDSVKTTNKERLDLQIDNELGLRDIALASNQLSAAQRLQIEADSDAKIRQLRKQYAQDQLQDELTTIDQNSAARIDAIKKTLTAQATIQSTSAINGGPNGAAKELGEARLSTDGQKELIDELQAYEYKSFNARAQAYQKMLDTGEIGYKEYTDYIKGLAGEELASDRATAAAKQKLDTDALAKHKAQVLQEVSASLNGVSEGLQILGTLYAQQDKAANDKLAAQKQRVQDELDAGNISAKEAKRRNDQLDIQSKKLQIEQAKRNKKLAIFQAIVSTAVAVVNGLATPPAPVGIVLAAIAAAVGAAQIAVVASQPLPTFAKGKRDRYSGPGLMSEAGAEILQTSRGRFLIPEPTVVNLRASDRIFTAQETRKIMNGLPEGSEDLRAVAGLGSSGNRIPAIDYARLGKAVGDNIPQSGINIDEKGFHRYNDARTEFNERRRSRREWRLK